ncbi:MAG TPA: hypothetical protein VLL52_12065 [Anaerolineae bacterium]|nr:hypothetical protein [Anaerolineae bacterium]
MKHLPITHMTLYKHGVGFFERRAELGGKLVRLTFREAEMNDILKSLTVIDYGQGQVLGVDYPTPQTRAERLAGCSLDLRDQYSVRDLLIGLRGRDVSLQLADGVEKQGKLVGLDKSSKREGVGASLVGLLVDGSAQVEMFRLDKIVGVVLVDTDGLDDLRFFLETEMGQEDYRQVTIRLTEGAHDLAVSYVAPAPTWRVSYRLMLAGEDDEKKEALLMGWGIFDNQLEEDLENISLSLVAGMPISFVYKLYEPFMPERPVVEEEGRTAAAPVMFEAPQAPMSERARGITMASAPAPAGGMTPAPKMRASREAVAQSTVVNTSSNDLGELFQYNISTPVSVGRGQSAMVPIVSAMIPYRKALLYNGSKMPKHPVATVWVQNETGLTLERGPVTVLGTEGYMGEAMVPFTGADNEMAVPYAVELGVTVSERSSSWHEMHRLQIKGVYVHFEEWHVREHKYQINNRSGREQKVLVEYPRHNAYQLVDTVAPAEKTDEHVRFAVTVGSDGEETLTVRERRLTHRREDLAKQSYQQLQSFLERGLINAEVYNQIRNVLALWELISDKEKELIGLDEERKQIYERQHQIHANMKALNNTTRERAMRDNYVGELEDTEERVHDIQEEEEEVKREIARLKKEVVDKIKALGG